MNKKDLKRLTLVEKLADHLLEQGLQGASLRPLAAAAGTSDRMLLHYFSNKEELLHATLLLINDRLVAMLESVRAEPVPYQILLLHLAGMLKDPNVRPYLKIWLELAALSARGEEPYRSIGRKIGDGFLEWIAATLKVEHEDDRLPVASLTLATMEGLVLMDALGMDEKVSAALQSLSS